MLKKFLNYWLPVVFWCLLIFLFSSFTTPSTSEIYWKDFIIKKLAHMIEYAVLALLIYRALINYGTPKIKSLVISILFSVFYGLTDEFHQSFTPGREPHIRDVFFDTIGASLAMLLIWKRS